MYGTLAILAAFAFVYSVVASRLEKTPVSGAVVFMAFGLVTGPLGLGWLDLDVGGETLRTVAEWTLALVLFTDSANALSYESPTVPTDDAMPASAIRSV